MANEDIRDDLPVDQYIAKLKARQTRLKKRVAASEASNACLAEVIAFLKGKEQELGITGATPGMFMDEVLVIYEKHGCTPPGGWRRARGTA